MTSTDTDYISMARQTPAHPTLPQNDSPKQREARETQLAVSQSEYEWTDSVPAVEGVPVVKSLPRSEGPSLEWWIELVGIVLELAKNQVAVEASLIEQGFFRARGSTARCRPGGYRCGRKGRCFA